MRHMRGLSAAVPVPAAKPAPAAIQANASAENATTNATDNATDAEAPQANASEKAQGVGEVAPRPDRDDFSWLDGEAILPPTALISFKIPEGQAPEPWMGRMASSRSSGF